MHTNAHSFDVSLSFRSVWVENVDHLEYWIHTGLLKIPLSSFMKSYVWILSTRLSVVIQTPNGLQNQLWSTEKWEVSPQQTKNLVVLERVVAMPRLLVDQDGPAGTAATFRSSTERDNFVLDLFLVKNKEISNLVTQANDYSLAQTVEVCLHVLLIDSIWSG